MPRRPPRSALRRMMPPARGSGLPFWTDPIFVVTIIIGVSLTLFAMIGEKTFLSEYRQPRQDLEEVLSTYGLIWLAVVTGFIAGRILVPGATLGSPASELAHAASIEPKLRISAWAAVVMTLLGYAIYFASSNASPAMFLSAMQGELKANFALKDSFDKIPGITSFMNLACWWFVYIAFRLAVQRKPITVLEIGITLLLFGLTLVRGFAVNERRVIFELFVPAAIACVFWKRHWGPAMMRFIWIGPLLAPLALCVVFAITEYFRSWTNFWQFGMTELPYIQWALVRLAGYYVTAINNGIAALSDPALHTWGTLTFSGIAKFPFLNDLFWTDYDRLTAMADYKAIITRLANEEFNNPGGASVVMIDFGKWGGAAVLFFTGFFISITYRMAQRGGLISVMLYSQVFFSMLEITRFWNFLSSFSVINLIFIGILATSFAMSGDRATRRAVRRARPRRRAVTSAVEAPQWSA